MELDMYLNANRYLWSSGTDAELSATIGKTLDTRRPVKTVTVEAAYWRKANAIHGWIVDNVQDGEDDCKEYEIEREDLQKLIDLCKQVKAEPDKAAELLPPTDGFFFGTNKIDDWYFQDIDTTIEQLTAALNEFGKEWYFTYSASW